MEFFETVENRRTVRQFLNRDVDFSVIRKILDAGNRAPTWNHNRTWNYIILRTE